MPDELLTTREVARHLGIHEKQVYALVKAGRIPATRATGKWLFPKRLLDEWLEDDARAGLKEARRKAKRRAGALLAAGSNDPILDILQSSLREWHPDLYLFSAATGSTAGLDALNDGYVDVAFSHLWDPKSGRYNVPFLPRLVPKRKPVVVNLFHREIGLVAAAGNPFGIESLRDLARRGVRFINRQAGSGTRVFLDHHLRLLRLKPSAVKGYEKEAVTHYEVCFAILSDEADAGLATRSAAAMLGLVFAPLARESFDMVLDQATFFTPDFQAVLGLLSAEGFRKRVGRLEGYDFSESGKVVHAVTQ